MAANRFMAAFRTLWTVTGRLKLKIVRPVSEWTLPGGITYNIRADAFFNGSNQRVNPEWQIWAPMVEVRYLPGTVTTNFQLLMPGVAAPESGLQICLPPDQWVLRALDNAWGVRLPNGFLYRIESDNRFPLGGQTVELVQLGLKEAGQEVGEQKYAHV